MTIKLERKRFHHTVDNAVRSALDHWPSVDVNQPATSEHGTTLTLHEVLTHVAAAAVGIAESELEQQARERRAAHRASKS